MYRVAVVEDVPAEQDALKRYLTRYGQEAGWSFDVTVYGTGDDFLQAPQDFDLVFMDIEMPGLDGMESAHLWRSWAPETPLVFVTNLANYALKGYEVDAFGFLVKPVGWSDFKRVMEKARALMEARDHASLAVPTRDGTYSVPYRTLAYIEVSNHDLIYHLTDRDEPLWGKGPLKNVESQLEEGPFVRISSCYLVNMDHVKRVSSTGVLLSTGESLEFSRPRKKEATARIVAHMAGA